eukprot:808705-Amphidinium_carterae.1
MKWQKVLESREVEKLQYDGTTCLIPVTQENEVAAQSHFMVLQALCKVLESSRKGLDLHLTPVRNENAYFACLNEILQTRVAMSHAVPESA